MGLNFGQFANDGNHFLNELQNRLGISDRDRTARIFRGILLREHVSQGEMEKVKHMMPLELHSVFDETLAEVGT